MRKEMIQYVYNSIELNIQRMIIYKNIGLDNIRKKEKRKENKYFWRCVLVL
jgi:hypothetical protein